MALSAGRRAVLKLVQRRCWAARACPEGERSAVAFRAVQEARCSTSGTFASTCSRRYSSEAAANTTQAARYRGPLSYVSLALTLGTGAALVLYFRREQERRLKEAHAKQQQQVAGTAAIGGPFQLVDQDGRPFTDKDLLGKFALIYFGFTFCPDICPEELEKLATAVDGLDAELQPSLQPVFISIDPARDSVAQVKSYVTEFHPRLIGLTGPEDKVREAAKAYRVYFSKTDESQDYLVDHSIIMYLINPRGEFVTFFGKNYTPEELSTSIAQHMQDWKA